jgi:hypothetical protein
MRCTATERAANALALRSCSAFDFSVARTCAFVAISTSVGPAFSCVCDTVWYFLDRAANSAANSASFIPQAENPKEPKGTTAVCGSFNFVQVRGCCFQFTHANEKPQTVTQTFEWHAQPSQQREQRHARAQLEQQEQLEQQTQA